MGNRMKLVSRTLALMAVVTAPLAAAAVPVSASPSQPFGAVLAGTIQITGVGPNGPTSAYYSGEGLATQLGAASMEGTISIVGPASCPGGFAATHADTMTASNGDRLVLTITETSCPRPDDPSTYDCTGTYTVTGGSGRYSTATGRGAWSGTVTFSAAGSGTFSTNLAGVLSGP